MTTQPLHPFADIVPIVCADELAYVVFERRDVETMSRFLIDFGFSEVGQFGHRRFFRGFGDLPYSVELISSERDAFIGFALVASQSDDLEKLAESTGVKPVDRCKPGGGRSIKLVDPAGFQVELIHGIDRVETQTQRDVIPQANTPWVKERVNSTVRPPAGPPPLRGMGHLVIQAPNFEETVRWYMECFGFLPSDLLHAGGQTNALALGFFRLNRGSTPADHHSLAILGGPEPALLHVSTETLDIDAIGQGQQHLFSQGWNHHWGMGRHVLGSQLFDYWLDPAGDEWEHYADGDMLTADYPVGIHKLDRGGLWAWGHDLPDSMRPPGPAPQEAPQAVQDLVNAMLEKPRPWLD